MVFILHPRNLRGRLGLQYLALLLHPFIFNDTGTIDSFGALKSCICENIFNVLFLPLPCIENKGCSLDEMVVHSTFLPIAQSRMRKNKTFVLSLIETEVAEAWCPS